MKDGCKKRLYELASGGKNIHDVNRFAYYGILNRAKDAINREGKWILTVDHRSVRIMCLFNANERTEICYRNHNNSEQDALEAALEYIDKEGMK